MLSQRGMVNRTSDIPERESELLRNSPLLSKILGLPCAIHVQMYDDGSSLKRERSFSMIWMPPCEIFSKHHFAIRHMAMIDRAAERSKGACSDNGT